MRTALLGRLTRDAQHVAREYTDATWDVMHIASAGNEGLSAASARIPWLAQSEHSSLCSCCISSSEDNCGLRSHFSGRRAEIWKS